MREPLADDQEALLASIEGAGAFYVLLPLIRGLAMHIAGVAPCPPPLRDLPELSAPISVERARYRAARARGDVKC